MKILIRADATPAIGAGHVSRCLELARLASNGAQITLAGWVADPRLLNLMAERGITYLALNETQLPDPAALQAALPASLIILDHYELGLSYEQALKPHADKLAVLDDLTRPHDCDVLIDPNLRHGGQTRYTGKLLRPAQLFLGPAFALLRPEFDARRWQAPAARPLKQLLVYFGGSDAEGQIGTFLDGFAAAPLAGGVQVMVIAGPMNSSLDRWQERAQGLAGVTVVAASNDMAGLLAQADLAAGTCGTAAWERCLAGVPAIVTITAENQREDAEVLHQLGAVVNLGWADQVTAADWAAALAALADPAPRLKMAQAAQAVMADRAASLAALRAALRPGNPTV